jgi:hypothetical protein
MSTLILPAKDGPGQNKMRAPYLQVLSQGSAAGSVVSKLLLDCELYHASAWRVFPTTSPLAKLNCQRTIET